MHKFGSAIALKRRLFPIFLRVHDKGRERSLEGCKWPICRENLILLRRRNRNLDAYSGEEARCEDCALWYSMPTGPSSTSTRSCACATSFGQGRARSSHSCGERNSSSTPGCAA